MLRWIRRLALALAGLALSLLLVACGLHVANSGDGTLPPRGEALRVATLNVHYIRLNAAQGDWSVADWERRKGPLDLAFNELGPALMAFQEMESFGRGDTSGVNLTLDWLLERNPGHRAAATGDPAEFPSTQPILYRAERLELLDQGWYFFSDTPEVIYSRTFNGSWPAFATWARFRDRETGTAFRAVNVHFEYRSGSNRLLSAALVRDRTRPWVDAGEPVILLGDINALHGSPTMERLEEAGLDFLPVEGSTYHFNRGVNLFGAIDHVAVTAGIGATDPVVLRRQFDGEWPTDHYPVVADLTF